jgi:hypothetical protein
LVEGTAQEIERAKAILSHKGIQERQVFFALRFSTVVE